MESIKVSGKDGATAHLSRFGAGGGAEEFHVHATPSRGRTFDEQRASLESVYDEALRVVGLDAGTAVFRRIFLSDVANQEASVRRSRLGDSGSASPCALSIVEQPPLPEMKAALWAYHVRDRAPLEKTRTANGIALNRGSRTHLFTTELGAAEGAGRTSHEQTHEAFDAYDRILGAHAASLCDNVVRTWLYVQGIDQNYEGMVNARRELFLRNGLTPSTHFIASTGIEGRHADPRRLVVLDALAIAGLRPRQMRYLSARENLSPTSAYGVTFERGTRVDFGDRGHVYISGTASIDATGQTLHVGDLRRQTERTFENVEALLREAGAGFGDVAQILVYLRDAADRPFIADLLTRRFPQTPALILRAPVCRPSWLVEVECIAITPNADPRWQAF